MAYTFSRPQAAFRHLYRGSNTVRLFDIVGIFFVAVWAVGVVAFVFVGHGTSEGEAISLTDGAIELTEDTVWMTVYREGDEVGALREDRTRIIDGWLFEMQGIATLELADDTYAFRFVSRSTLNEDLTLRSATASVDAFGMSLEMDGTYLETDGDPRFRLTVRLGDSTEQFIADLDEQPRLAQHAIPQLLATEELEEGDLYEQEFFDPLTLSPSNLTLEYEGRTDVTSHGGVYEDAHSFGQSVGNLRSRIRTDEHGEVLQQVLPMQIAVDRMPDAVGKSHFADFEQTFEERSQDAPPFVDAIDTDDLLALVARFGSGEIDRLRTADEDDDPLLETDEDDDRTEFQLSNLADIDDIELMSPRQHIALQTSDQARVETDVANPLWHAGDAPIDSDYQPRATPDDDEVVESLADQLSHSVDAARNDVDQLDATAISAALDDVCPDETFEDTGDAFVAPWPDDPAGEPDSPVECLALLADATTALDLPPHFVHGAVFDGRDFHQRVWIAWYDQGHYFGEFDPIAADAEVGADHIQLFVDDRYDPHRTDPVIDFIAPH